jgi:hypothetical protein
MIDTSKAPNNQTQLGQYFIQYLQDIVQKGFSYFMITLYK